MASDSVGQLVILRMNQAQPPFDDPKMRQALRYAIDQAQFRGAYSDDSAMAQSCTSVFACTSPYASAAGWSAPDLERARARALVREAGYDGKPVPLLDVADYFTHPHALLVAQMLKDIGITPDLLSSDSTTWVARRAKRTGWSLAVVAPSGMDAADPMADFALRANCDKAWYGWPCDDRLEQLRAQWADAPDLATRRQIAEQIQIRALDVGPCWPLGMVFGIRGYRADLQGFLRTPVPVYWNISRQ